MYTMLSFGKSKKFANIVIDDYVIRVVESNGPQLSNVKQLKERPIPAELIEQGRIADEIKFFDFMKQLVRDWKLKHLNVRFYAPESLVIMRQVEYPAHLNGNEVTDHFTFELGQSIHLPFENPVFDIHPMPEDEQANGRKKATLFAAPEEEISKFTHIFTDVHLQPKVVDVRPLGIYRYFHHLDKNRPGEVYLFFELNMLSLNISIFSDNRLEFTRFQPLDLDPNHLSYSLKDEDLFNWSYSGDESFLERLLDDQISELDRIMGFYRYSLYKGEKNVSQIIMTGDHPLLENVKQKIEQQYGLPVRLLKAYLAPSGDKETEIRFVPALGLVLKEGE
ncbi:type IV pilus biogenesis protein PilM [Siminovitchia fortis]|uniref:type IV pilus biogenesis protein PilM n=2 Tax=Siminovitchia fortis TaxID=254758 RepID=UPI0011AAFFD2|nr:pilus assembly protein PilM [Siminovitchia fortis]